MSFTIKSAYNSYTSKPEKMYKFKVDKFNKNTEKIISMQKISKSKTNSPRSNISIIKTPHP